MNALTKIIAMSLLLTLTTRAQHEGSHSEGSHMHKKKAASEGSAGISEVVAMISPTTGNSAHGIVRFQRDGNKVKVIADIKGLTPKGQHGFHIHEFGDCSSGDGTSAGGHYNPGGHPHAGPDADMRHAGDLGNILADETGKGHYERVVANISLAGEKNPVVGRSVIVHAAADDLTTQPTGNAGGRIGCGVIGIGKIE